MATAEEQTSSATSAGQLWSAKARDWAELQEGHRRVDFEQCIRHTGIAAGIAVLDVGCGAGGFCRLAAEAGATVTGIDAAPGMIDLARERVPLGRFDVGDLQALPYDDCSFDVITGFHSFPFAADPLAALIEARRVAKPGAPLFVVIFGRERRNELVAVLEAIRALLPPALPGAPGPLVLSPPEVLDGLLARAGLAVTADGYLESAYEYPDLKTALRAIGSAGPTVRAARLAGEAAVTDAITRALAPYRTVSGGYRLEVESRYVIAR